MIITDFCFLNCHLTPLKDISLHISLIRGLQSHNVVFKGKIVLCDNYVLTLVESVVTLCNPIKTIYFNIVSHVRLPY